MAKLNLKDVRLEKALSTLFTQRQLEIIQKVMKMDRLSKNENETYSRTIKPKLNAIIDAYETALTVRSKD